MTAVELEQQLDSLTGQQWVQALFGYMHQHGQSFYDEVVTQLEHALQCGNQALLAGADDWQVTAALLHDLGHFLLDEHDQQAGFLAQDQFHEDVGADLLEKYFPAEVCVPIRMHVPAKRYLCTVDAEYHDQLSLASQRSLELQGGKLSESEKAEMDASPHLDRALVLRRWDDLAKKPDMQTPMLDQFAKQVERSLLPAYRG